MEDDLIYTDYLNIAENHYRLFSNKKVMNDELERYTGLYTIIQKNLLSKYKVNIINQGKESTKSE
jgi:hypothetical protein